MFSKTITSKPNCKAIKCGNLPFWSAEALSFHNTWPLRGVANLRPWGFQFNGDASFDATWCNNWKTYDLRPRWNTGVSLHGHIMSASQSSAQSSCGWGGKSARFVGIDFLQTSTLPCWPRAVWEAACPRFAQPSPDTFPQFPIVFPRFPIQVAHNITKVFPFHPKLAVEVKSFAWRTGQKVCWQNLWHQCWKDPRLSTLSSRKHTQKTSRHQSTSLRHVKTLRLMWTDVDWCGLMMTDDWSPRPISACLKTFLDLWIGCPFLTTVAPWAAPHSSFPHGFRICTKRIPSTSLAWRSEYLETSF